MEAGPRTATATSSGAAICQEHRYDHIQEDVYEYMWLFLRTISLLGLDWLRWALMSFSSVKYRYLSKALKQPALPLHINRTIARSHARPQRSNSADYPGSSHTQGVLHPAHAPLQRSQPTQPALHKPHKPQSCTAQHSAAQPVPHTHLPTQTSPYLAASHHSPPSTHDPFPNCSCIQPVPLT
ncbi:hypothetical protein IQ07DRAFT_587141 [Pyrenochaeta sp. DS3sAY3a]|nr:hypothetical protein IQ07DRAFT_587141 [Pyrenochaeta sp. DS3sAY3a]